IGFEEYSFRSCLVPGRPFQRLSPFGMPEESNVRIARSLQLATAAGLYRLAEDALANLQTLHAAGLAHGDAELHNFVVCPSPLELRLDTTKLALIHQRMKSISWYVGSGQSASDTMASSASTVPRTFSIAGSTLEQRYSASA